MPTSLQASTRTGTGKEKGQAHPKPSIRRPRVVVAHNLNKAHARPRAPRMPPFGPLCQTQACRLLLCLSGAIRAAGSSALCVDDTLACALVVDRQLLKALLSDSSAAMPSLHARSPRPNWCQPSRGKLETGAARTAPKVCWLARAAGPALEIL